MYRRIQRITTLALSLFLVVVGWSVASWAHDLDEIESKLSEKLAASKVAINEELKTTIVASSRLKTGSPDEQAPLQVETAVDDREAGLVNAAKVLRKATQSHRIRIVYKFVGSVSDQSPVRTTFNSASPIRIISAQSLREAGLVHSQDIFQRTTK